MLLGVDVSHHQGSINFSAVKGAGHSFAILKATEGTGYIDPMFAGNRAKAHAAGLVVGMYHFARAGDPYAEAAYFARTVAPMQANEFLVLDWEVPAKNPPAWCKTWLSTVETALRSKPVIYLNQSARDSFDWSATIAAGHQLWLAKYDNSTVKSGSGAWPSLAMKQYSDRGTVPGIGGTVDVNAFYGDMAALLALGTGGGISPTDGGFLMALTDDEQRRILEWANVGLFEHEQIKSSTDRLEHIQTTTDNVSWGLLDEKQGVRVTLAAILAKVSSSSGSGVTAADVAALIPQALAQDVVDELQRRLSA